MTQNELVTPVALGQNTTSLAKLIALGKITPLN